MPGKTTLSPLQLKQLIFNKVFVEPYDFSDDENVWAPTFDFDGVQINTGVMVGSKLGEEDDPRDYLVRVKVEIPNDEGAGKVSPYSVDIEAQAWFELSPSIEIGKRQEIMDVNGPSVIVGAIREMLTMITARSVYGPMTLPTLRFFPESVQNQ